MAGKTFTEQMNLPPASANSLTADGEGMHSLIPHNLVRGLNNLGTYVNNHFQYMQPYQNAPASTQGRRAAPADGGEVFLVEFPVLVPLWAVRMVWTAGARCQAVSMSAISVYLSRDPYRGANSGAFDTSGLSTGYRTRSVGSLGLTVGVYSLATDTTTGITPIDDSCTRIFSPGRGLYTKRKGYVTVTGTGGASAYVAVEDFTVWFLPT